MSDQIALNVRYLKQLGGTPYLGFAVQAHAALLDEGLADPTTAMVGWGTSAMVAHVGRDMLACGIITFNHAEWDNRFDIGVGYVMPDYRRRGIYRLMWDELVLEAQRLKVARIYSAVKISNASMMKVATALGRHAESFNVLFEVPAI